MPALSKAREQAKALVCQNNLKQLILGVIYWAEESDDRLEMDYEGGNYWYHKIAPNFGDEDYRNDPQAALKGVMEVMFCPSTKRSEGTDGVAGTAKKAWRRHTGTSGTLSEGSYGMNCWLVPDFYHVGRPGGGKWSDWPGYNPEYHFGKFSFAKSATPVFGDSMWVGAWPGAPPDDPGNPTQDVDLQYGSTLSHMSRFCIDRHNMAINISFADTHVEKTPLDELWSFKWHKQYSIIPSADIILP